jgi:arylsulfatase A-like enzyme
VRFIRTNRDRPFFLYLAYNGPYGLGPLLDKPARNRHKDYYADKPLLSFHRDAMHPWLFNNKQYLNNPVSIRRVAAETSGVDDGVGQVMATLKELGLDERTLVVYAADQGWMGGTNGIWGMGDHTRPMGAFDGMMRIPWIFRHSGSIRPGTKSDAMVSNYDFLPTVLSYLNLRDEPNDARPKSPGRDFSPVLHGKPLDWENVIYYEMEFVRAIRTDRWKYVHRPEGPYELYDLTGDPYEKFNLYGQPQHLTIQRDLKSRLDTFFDKTAEPKYNLYRGGTSKATLLSGRRD